MNLSSSNHEGKKTTTKKYRAKETCRHRYITVKRCCCSLANTKKKTKSKRPLRFDFEIVWKRPNRGELTFRMHFDGATSAISAIFSFFILNSMIFSCILNENIFYFENNCFEISFLSNVIDFNSKESIRDFGGFSVNTNREKTLKRTQMSFYRTYSVCQSEAIGATNK